VTDPAFTGCEKAAAAAAPAELPPDQSFSFTCTDPQPAHGYTNIAFVAGTGPDGKKVDDADDAKVEIVQPVISVLGNGRFPVVSPVALRTDGGAGASPPSRGELARTGSGIDRLVLLAVTAMALGLVAVALSGRRRRQIRRLAFARWVQGADLDQLLAFADNLADHGSRRRALRAA